MFFFHLGLLSTESTRKTSTALVWSPFAACWPGISCVWWTFSLRWVSPWQQRSQKVRKLICEVGFMSLYLYYCIEHCIYTSHWVSDLFWVCIWVFYDNYLWGFVNEDFIHTFVRIQVICPWYRHYYLSPLTCKMECIYARFPQALKILRTAEFKPYVIFVRPRISETLLRRSASTSPGRADSGHITVSVHGNLVGFIRHWMWHLFYYVYYCCGLCN